MPDHEGSPRSFPKKERRRARTPTIHRRAHLGAARSLAARTRDGPSARLSPSPATGQAVVFEKLGQILVFGCAYWRIADEGCSATTLRRRRDEWIEEGTMDALREMVLGAYDRLIGLVLDDLAVDGCITKAPCGGEKADNSPVDRGKRGIKRSTVVDACDIRLRHPPR